MTDSIVLGGGCFWCLEAAYQRVRGVTSVVSGYSGGHDTSPTYESVSAGKTGHAEVVQVVFEPAHISLSELLDIFWVIHDPTTPNRQGADVGPQYRSIILYNSPQQKLIAEQSIKRIEATLEKPVVTELKPLETFYPAEDYHQNYYNTHHEAMYCQVVIDSKLHKLQHAFAAKLRPDSL